MGMLHSAEIPDEYLQGLDRLLPGTERLALPPAHELYPSIAAHPDIRICPLDAHTFVVAPSVPGTVVSRITEAGIRVVRSSASPRGKYPDTAILNAVRVGGHVFHNTHYTDQMLKDAAKELGLTLVHVAQGYARCSVIPVGERALITCDRGIEKAAREVGLDAKLVATDTVLLPGEKHGFIGGASGVMPDGRVVFLGDMRTHPDGEGIVSFLTAHGVACGYPGGLPLFDAGTAIFF